MQTSPMGIRSAVLAFSLTAFCALQSDALAQDRLTPAISCQILSEALRSKRVTPEFYDEHCANSPSGTDVVVTSSASGTDDIIQAILTRAPSMLQTVKRYGSAEKILSLLSRKSLNGERSLAADLTWSLYRDLIEYVTSGNLDYYVEEFVGSKGDRQSAASSARVTTPFWIALRANDPFFIRQVLTARLSPYKLEGDRPQTVEFPCAANIYLCVIASKTLLDEEKKDVLSVLSAFGLKLPSWSYVALAQEFTPYQLANHDVPNARVCDASGAGDCTLAMQLLQQGTVAAQGEPAPYIFSDYGGYDGHGQRHLLTGRVGDGVFAAWIPAAANGNAGSRKIEIVALKTSGGQLSQFKNQTGKRIEFKTTQYSSALLSFDAFESKHVIRILERSFQ